MLDLGAGTGRIADPLVALGHDVLAVDSSAEMLAAVRSARTHRARIEDLDLADGVLSATVTYRDGSFAWAHRFRATRLTDDDLDADRAAARLRRVPPPLAPSWLVAQAQR